MKKKFALTLYMIFCLQLVEAQNYSTDVNLLENIKSNYLKNITALTDSINKIDLQIQMVKSRETLSAIKDSSITAIAIKFGKLKKKPEVTSEILYELQKDEKVIILDYKDEFFGVCVNKICGYMNEMWITKTERVTNFIEFKNNEKEKLKILNYERKIKQEDKEFAEVQKRNQLKYGKKVYSELKKGMIWIGMSKEMAIIALGYPLNTNNSVGSWGVHEQWVYNSSFYYFENGKLTSYQN